jgi:hypothetical protein
MIYIFLSLEAINSPAITYFNHYLKIWTLTRLSLYRDLYLHSANTEETQRRGLRSLIRKTDGSLSPKRSERVLKE